MAELFSIMTHHGDKNSNIAVQDVYNDLVNIVTPIALPLGSYEFGFSLTMTYDQVNKSEFIRFSIDGGSSWTEFQTEPSDKLDETPFMYQFFKNDISGITNMIVQARKQDAAGVMHVAFADCWIKRVA